MSKNALADDVVNTWGGDTSGFMSSLEKNTSNPWGVGLYGRTNNITDDFSLNTDLDFLKKEKPGFFEDTLGIGTIADGLGLASSMYSDYLKDKYLNKAMDTMDYNLAAAKKADTTHYNNAAGWDSFSSKHVA